MFGTVGWQEILFILLIILLLFGSKRIPEVARSLGKGVKEFKGAMRDLTKEVEERPKEEEEGKENPRNSNSK